MFRECPLVHEPYPPLLLQRARELLSAIAGQLRSQPFARQAALAISQRYPRHAAQIDADARLLGVDALDLTLANISYDLLLGLFGCSTLVLATAEGPFVARNMDWPMPDRIARASCIVPLESGLHAGVLGSTGVVSGQSRHGFAVVLNAVLSGPMHLGGYPVLLFVRHLLDTARSFDEALELCSQTPLASGALLTLAGTHNAQRVCVERAPQGHRQRRPHGDEPLVVTNHYRHLAAPEVCSRYEFLSRRLRREPHPADEELLELLGNDNVKQDITAQHVLACPARGLFRMLVPAQLLDDGRRGDDLASLHKLF
jgi:hypothetical protein